MPRLSVFRSKFFWKIYAAFALLFLAISVLESGIVSLKVRDTLQATMLDGLRAKAEFLEPHAREVLSGATPRAPALIKALGASTSTRVTIIKVGGEVVEESDRDERELDNHWERPEVQQALTTPFGLSERYSDTLKKPLIYLARAVRDADGKLLGAVRVSVPAEQAKSDVAALLWTLTAVALVGVLAALFFGWTLTQRVAEPVREMVEVAEALRAGKYEVKVRNLAPDELGRLGDTLNRLGSELTGKIEELHRLENVRRDFVANVSHEIKTPLTSIKGYVETLLSGAIDDPERRVRFLEKIDRNALRLANLVQDILSLAKIEATEGAFKPAPIDLVQVVGSVVARHEDQVAQKSLKLRVQAPPTPLVVMGDREAMTQVCDNLVSNAVKYTPEGGRITVTLFGRAPWGKLEVEDTGIGIPEEHLPRIFERFYRVDKARSRDLGGTGLGLSIVKHLVHAMSGEVGVESRVGLGSKFTIKLRLAD
jgi:two-component system phosphate regulon sensor histidine kinase PhoR